MENLYHFDNSIEKRTFPINNDDRDKYVVICVAKNEKNYIREWVEHYLNLGFDKIIIGNNDDDQEVITNLLEPEIKEDKVEVFNCAGLFKFQKEFYSMFSRVGNYKWAFYCDCDEFLELNEYDNIKDFLQSKNDVDVVCFSWMVMSNNGEVKPKTYSVKERFKHPLMPINGCWNYDFKSIVSGNKHFIFTNVHIPCCVDDECTYDYGGLYRTNQMELSFFEPLYKDGYIRHYQSKSYTECVEKNKRGYPDGGVCENALAVFEYGKQHSYETITDLKNKNVVGYDDLSKIFFGEINWAKTIWITKDDDYTYPSIFFKVMIDFFNKFSNKLFVIDGPYNNALFTDLIGYAMITNNKLVFNHKGIKYENPSYTIRINICKKTV